MSKYYGKELYHFGVKGMHLGKRRYQNKDGSLTPLGQKHYNGDRSDDFSGSYSVVDTEDKRYAEKRRESTRNKGPMSVSEKVKSVIDKVTKTHLKALGDAAKAGKNKLDELVDKGHKVTWIFDEVKLG